ncbi:GNAT family N-acetyltransferase [Adhaeribacter sp. BT258]|uniref:GNAT family N-acetyltransferase n=1 Tax=Adhaeribacter terrigena TaxID=2793070 RepID=A0ABS1BZX9_9BACT|nr:GNAT family N-acetyltransferase [Adhaeribacter terrigena]MBK0402472.1 GNAT family N-acetyltransferase [Adhaeribacter terrigena]
MLEIELNPFTYLHTERLLLREVQETDAPEIFIFRSDDRIMQYLDREKLNSETEALEFIGKYKKAIHENEGINWGICLKDSDKLIGTIGLWRFIKANHRAEIGYSLHPDFWNKGLMREAMQAVLDYGFQTLKLHSIEANINPKNEASRKLLEKHGFVQEAYFREDYYFQGKFLDSVILSLIDPATRNPSKL